MLLRYFLPATAAFFLLCCSLQGHAQRPAAAGSYDALLSLFEEWRVFEAPPLREGAPDYTAATFAARQPGVDGDKELVASIQSAITSTDELAEWLEEEAKTKTGPSGIGKDNYSWYLQNVHLVPLSWEDEVMLLKRELARAWSALKLEEHRNRKLPELTAADSPEAYDALAERSVQSLLAFLEQEEMVTVKAYFEPALREHLGTYIPEETRNFFWIGAHYDPRPLYSHFYHWFELARVDNEPHRNPIRRGPLLYNIFDSRSEGVATAVEEMFMQAGLYDDDPRMKEIVYILIAQRAARGLGSLYAHANEMTMAEAGGIHSEYTPFGVSCAYVVMDI